MKVLIVKLSSLGDVVHAMPAVQDLVHAVPDVQIDWVVERGFVPLVRRCKGVHRVIASDLRTVLSVMRIAANLERCGDYAKNLAKRSLVLNGMMPIEGAAGSIRRMARAVVMLLKDALDAYIARDVVRAREIRARDQEIDQMYSGLFRQLQAPVQKKLAASCEVFHAIGDFVDSQYAHGNSFQLAQGSGMSLRPQYMAFCSMYCWMPKRPFSRPRPLSFQPPNGVEMENCL